MIAITYFLANCECPKCGERFIHYYNYELIKAQGDVPFPQPCIGTYKLKDGTTVTGCRRDYAGQFANPIYEPNE